MSTVVKTQGHLKNDDSSETNYFKNKANGPDPPRHLVLSKQT